MELIGKNNSPFKRQPHKMVKHIQTIRWLVIFFAVIYFDQNGLKFENFAVNQFLFPLIKLSLRFACLYAELIVNDFSYNFQAGNYILKVKNRNARTKVWNMFKVNNEDTKNFIVNFEHISHVCSNVSIANFEQVNAGFINNNNSTYSLVTLVINRK